MLEVLRPAVSVLPELDDVKIRGISADSRQVKQGYIFVAIPGTELDGRQFINDAVERGASALLMSNQDIHRYLKTVPGALPVIGVDDPRLSAGLLASAFYGNPSEKMALIAITGTNGKTTTTYLLEGIFSKAGLNPGVIGTVNQRHRGIEVPSELTTPDAIKLQEILAGMSEQGAKAVALEVSSHALDQQRISGCGFAASVFTNLSRDHLDYHQDMEQYFQTKVKLFLEYPSDTAIINIDDLYGKRLWEIVQRKKISYGLSPEADVRPEFQSINIDGITGKLATPKGPVSIKSRLLGLHNLYNILASATTAIALGIDPDHIQTGIESIMRIPGRLDPVHTPHGITAFVDYAHTPDALESVLNSLVQLGPKPLICVIGCGGDRDRGKRPLMAQASASLADIVVLTSDNPRAEDPLAILDQMLNGIRDLPPHHPANKAEVKVIPDRKDAILWAAEQARPGACLLVAGKGHETCQIIGNKRLAFDDREILKEVFESEVRSQKSEVRGQRSEVGSRKSKLESLEDRGFRLKVSQVAMAIGATVLSGDPDTAIYDISTDSRSVRKGNIFWALSGDRFNGHDFVLDAIKKGAIGAVVSSTFDFRHTNFDLCRRPVLLQVQDSLKALGDFAAWYREHLGIKVIGITGSCGKTTTKELIFSIMGKKWKVAKTPGNFNNLIGLPLSLLSAKSDDSWAVLEMGTNQPGEIPRLCEIAQPQVGLITTIQPAHLVGLGDIKQVAREKWELWRALPETGVAVVNLDDPLVMEGTKDLTCQIVGYSMEHKAPPSSNHQITKSPNHQITCLSWTPGGHGTLLDLNIAGSRLSVDLPLIGRANVQNAVASAAIGHAVGLTPARIKQGLEEVKPISGRLFLKNLGPEWRLIDDSYNANPGSMRAALETLDLWGKGEKKIAILGDMLELGDAAYDFHQDIGRLSADTGVDLLILVGEFADAVSKTAQKAGISQKAIHIFPNTEDLLSWMESATPSCMPSPATILVKGSRAIGLERAADTLVRHLGEGEG
ncbi:MAG: UDP-N-acetylmuramoyl-L-alanyl-D-glutamate--2,6-diaminopimelate ligase [Thermodesulfobacteriota bacterium]|nr:UDP-N-acetylmuramoyl-L-alanyl-D-glutamate--2,6-diaminopimelate ligase [Thermodesulfobacteriota bacterium]